MRRASEMAHIGKIMQIGIRGIGSSQLSDFQDAEAYGNIIITSREVRQKEWNGWPAAFHRQSITIFPLISTGWILPSPSEPVPLCPSACFYEEASAIIEAIAQRGCIVGMDMVEISPPCDHQNMTSMYGAQLMLDTMSFLTKAREKAVR